MAQMVARVLWEHEAASSNLATPTTCWDVRVWFMVPVLKTGEPRGSGGSNPSLSASATVYEAYP